VKSGEMAIEAAHTDGGSSGESYRPPSVLKSGSVIVLIVLIEFTKYMFYVQLLRVCHLKNSLNLTFTVSIYICTRLDQCHERPFTEITTGDEWRGQTCTTFTSSSCKLFAAICKNV
jgi:hypothetical protein